MYVSNWNTCEPFTIEWIDSLGVHRDGTVTAHRAAWERLLVTLSDGSRMDVAMSSVTDFGNDAY